MRLNHLLGANLLDESMRTGDDETQKNDTDDREWEDNTTADIRGGV